MGKFLDAFKKKSKQLDDSVSNMQQRRLTNPRGYNRNINPNARKGMGDLAGVDEVEELEEGYPEDEPYDDYQDKYNPYDDVGVQPAQKPESFHHFILENQYKDLERSIRGLKDVWNPKENKWITKRKEMHCFTDEEAEDILRTAQSHLATDVKLGFIKAESFGDYMDAVYKELAFLFESIAEYRYGRYGSYENQYKMKLQNQKIFLELFTRVQMNYSRAIAGQENKATHGSVRGQESLQSGERDLTGNGRGVY